MKSQHFSINQKYLLKINKMKKNYVKFLLLLATKGTDAETD